MNRMLRIPAAILLVSLWCHLLAPSPSFGQGGGSPLTPPQSHAFGRSFEGWNVLQTQFALATGLGGETGLSGSVGRVRLLPGSFSDPTPEFDVTLRPGTPFVAAPFFVYGERYADPNVPDDDPAALAPLLEEIIGTAEVHTVLDGRVLLDGTGDELERYQFGPIYFDEPIVYAQTQANGAAAALWVTGIGSVYHPLPVGRHTLEYTVHSEFFGDFHFTYHITVSPK
ncbi:hypothetical protein [Paludisphaera soli]|uniref:hypothetical protein n=1 Tax=Paludisphaera soli TaxID=2712865 RepID=UPI0013ED2EFA|nr:hypothetical protein [Paludisphaera soli]